MKNLKITEKDSKLIPFIENDNTALDSRELSEVTRIIIKKHNALVDHIQNI